MRLRSAQGSGVRAATILLVASLVSTAAGLADSHADLLRVRFPQRIARCGLGRASAPPR